MELFWVSVMSCGGFSFQGECLFLDWIGIAWKELSLDSDWLWKLYNLGTFGQVWRMNEDPVFQSWRICMDWIQSFEFECSWSADLVWKARQLVCELESVLSVVIGYVVVMLCCFSISIVFG